MINTIKSDSFNTSTINTTNTEDIKPTQNNSEILNQNETNTKPNPEQPSYNNKMDMDFKTNYYKNMLSQTSLTTPDKSTNKQSQTKTENQNNKPAETSATKEVTVKSSSSSYTPVTMQQMDKMIPGFSKRANSKQVLDALNYTMEKCECNTPERKAMFLAQTRVETGDFTNYNEGGGFTYFLTGVNTRKEIEINSTGRITIDNNEAKSIHRGYLKPDLNNKDVAEALRFTGKGFIQITGRSDFEGFNTWVNKNIKQDPKLKSSLENQVQKEVKDNSKTFIKAADDRIKNLDDSIAKLNETYIVKIKGEPEYVPGINTLERKIAAYQQSIDKLKKIPNPTEGQKTAIQNLTNKQAELKNQLVQTKAVQEKLKQDRSAIQDFKKNVEGGNFNLNLDKADFTQEPYAFLTGESTTLAGTTAEYSWKSDKVNKYADSEDVRGATKVINGGKIELEKRQANFDQALKVLK